MEYYNKSKNKHKTARKCGAVLTRDAVRRTRAGQARSAYLTRTNKSTSTPVDFELVLSKVDDVLYYFNRFARSLRSWIIDNSQKVVYE